MHGNLNKTNLEQNQVHIKVVIGKGLKTLSTRINELKLSMWEQESLESNKMIENFKSIDTYFKDIRLNILKNFNNRKNIKLILKGAMDFLDKFENNAK